MEHLKIAIGLFIVIGVMAVTTSPAMALGPRWVHCEKVTHGNWLDSRCDNAGAGEWETREVSQTSEITSSTVSGSKGIEMEDSKAGIAVTCAMVSRGTVGVNGTGSVKEVKFTGCQFVAGKNGSCEANKPVVARPVNLGWSTRLEERTFTSTELRDVITSLIAGKEPAWEVECIIGGFFKEEDKCEGIITTNVRADRANGTVETEYDKVSEGETATCKSGGAGSGRISGNLINRLRNGALWVLASVLKT